MGPGDTAISSVAATKIHIDGIEIIVLAVLSTQRLRLRSRTIADLEENLAMDLDPQVHCYIFPRRPDPQAHRKEILARISGGWPPYGGVWAVELLTARGFLGWCAAYSDDEPTVLELAYRLAADAWGQGIATEAARAVIDYVFAQLPCERVTAFHHPDNLRSRKVLEKLGFVRAGSKEYLGVLQPSYIPTRLDWRWREGSAAM